MINPLPSLRSMKANIWAGLLCATDQEIRDGMDFYSGANGLCKLLGRVFKLPADFVAGIYAALSPMNTWDTNVANIVDVLRLGNKAKVNTTESNRIKALEILDGKHPDLVLGGNKVRAFYLAIANPDNSTPIPVDRHLICLALGQKIGNNVQLRSITSRGLYSRVEQAYLELGRREQIGNRLASIAWFVQRRIIAGQIPLYNSGSPICCGCPMRTHGRTRFICGSCDRTRARNLLDYKRRPQPLYDVDLPPNSKFACAGRKGRIIVLSQNLDSRYVNASGWQYLSRYVVQVVSGERLHRDEHVHHTNGVLADCRQNNLEVWLAERHGRYHARHQLLYMLRDRFGRWAQSQVPGFEQQFGAESLDEVPF